MKSAQDKWNKFKNWQKNPYEVAPLREEQQVCATCGTDYKGNFCPRCGQSYKVQPKMSLSSTFLLFLDVWGLGNRGMFRTLRDLVLRPGYLICDYVNGRHGAYFPPFKLLFLLTTLSILIGHGFNIFMMDYIGDFKPLSISIQDETEILVSQWVNRILRFVYEYPALSSLTLMIFMANFIFLLFRKSKVIGKMSYHAIIIASVYMLDMNLLYTCFFRFFGAGSDIIYMSLLLYIIPLKQFSGYSMIKTVSRAFVALLLGLISILMLFIIIFAIATYITEPEAFFD